MNSRVLLRVHLSRGRGESEPYSSVSCSAHLSLRNITPWGITLSVTPPASHARSGRAKVLAAAPNLAPLTLFLRIHPTVPGALRGYGYNMILMMVKVYEGGVADRRGESSGPSIGCRGSHD